jgi:hypothetical protein
MLSFVELSAGRWKDGVVISGSLGGVVHSNLIIGTAMPRGRGGTVSDIVYTFMEYIIAL